MAAPTGDTTDYLTTGIGSATPVGDRGYDSISFYRGSIDSYNTLEVPGGGGAVLASHGGGEGWTPANGDRTSADTNRR